MLVGEGGLRFLFLNNLTGYLVHFNFIYSLKDWIDLSTTVSRGLNSNSDVGNKYFE